MNGLICITDLWILQDPLVTKGASLVPLLGIDVWEHAYYLQVISFFFESRVQLLVNSTPVQNSLRDTGGKPATKKL